MSQPPRRPYVTEIPTDEHRRLLALDWMTYLKQELGHTAALAALSYYHDIDWIADDTRATLTEYLSDVEQTDGLEDYVDADTRLAHNFHGFADTPFEPHVVSLMYVCALCNQDLDTVLHDVARAEKWIADWEQRHTAVPSL